MYLLCVILPNYNNLMHVLNIEKCFGMPNFILPTITQITIFSNLLNFGMFNKHDDEYIIHQHV